MAMCCKLRHSPKLFKYADRSKYYRYEGLGLEFLTTTPKLTSQELLQIREHGIGMNGDLWATSQEDAFNFFDMITSIPLVPGGSGSPVPAF